jgi:16S rRNA A1518/A1519 N6-dimethyltransferase RsmA/KsgA/DIM1 with predicted DNA glycosylase/AP lyase activity
MAAGLRAARRRFVGAAGGVVLARGLARALPVLPLAIAGGAARAQDDKPFSPFITTPNNTVIRMLSIAAVGKDDHVIDLGSGDGRIPITAALKFGASGFGVDLDAMLVELSNRNAAEAGVAARVRFERGDVFAADVRKATVVTLYMLPPIVQGLRPVLLRPLLTTNLTDSSRRRINSLPTVVDSKLLFAASSSPSRPSNTCCR